MLVYSLTIQVAEILDSLEDLVVVNTLLFHLVSVFIPCKTENALPDYNTTSALLHERMKIKIGSGISRLLYGFISPYWQLPEVIS